MFQAATWYICQCYQCLSLRTWQHCYSTETHCCCDGICTSVCAWEHTWHDTDYPDDTGASGSSVMWKVTCEICLYWETADRWDNNELIYTCTVVSFAHAIDFSICNSPVRLPGRGKFRLHLCTYERVRTLCFSMHNSLQVQQKLPTVTSSFWYCTNQ